MMKGFESITNKNAPSYKLGARYKQYQPDKGVYYYYKGQREARENIILFARAAKSKNFKINPRRRAHRKPIPEKRIKAKPRRKAVKRNPSKPHITARFSVRCDGKGIAFFKSRADAFAYAKALHRAKPKATISVEK